ncbi:MAG: hypothetical protein HY832_03010 [Candidatus Aenigmarchaeota archaeon]|nr:hypothetical protein [Candidatus Aenigmarchaeota archaeon]
MICIACGKQATGVFCSDCIMKKQHLIEVEDLMLFWCKECESVHNKGVVLEGTPEEVVTKELKRNIVAHGTIKDMRFAFKKKGTMFEVKVVAIGLLPGVTELKTEEHVIQIMLKSQLCEYCIKQRGGYYEALYQIRGPAAKEILEKAKKLLPKKSIVGIDEADKGYNVRIMSKKNAGAVVSKLKKVYTVKASYKHVATKKGAMIFRNFYAIQ